MSKIGNLIVELEETGAIEYDSQSREYITARERPIEEGLSITAGVITKRHRKKTFDQMLEGQSFFLATVDDDHSNRKVSALRSRAIRYQENDPEFYFSIRKESKGDERGVRFYRISNENN
jgi:hypothetical protein